VSRSGLLRAAALLAAGAAPLLAGAANAAEAPQLGTGLPAVGADQLVNGLSGVTQLANPLDAASAVQLPQAGAPVASDLPIPALPGLPAAAAQERSLQSPLGGLPAVKTPQAHGGNTHLGSVSAPVPSTDAVPNPSVLSGVLPTING